MSFLTDTVPTYPLPPGYPGLPTDWETRSGTVTAADGVSRLFVHHHRKKDPSRRKRVLFIVHGFGEHGGRYLPFAEALNADVDQIIAFDHRGHGRSEGLRGHAPLGFEQLVDDTNAVAKTCFEALSEKNAKVEFHAFGHSMGGHLLLRALRKWTEHPFQSVSISAPFFAIYAPAPAIKKAAAYALSRIWGSLQLSTELDANTISRDPGVVKNYLEDQLNHDSMTPKFFTSMMTAIDSTVADKSGIGCPILFQIPMKDRLIDSQTSLKYFESLNGVEKRLKTYSDSYHEGMNDLDRKVFLSDLGEWIREHSKGV